MQRPEFIKSGLAGWAAGYDIMPAGSGLFWHWVSGTRCHGLSDKRARAPLTCPIALERLPKGKVRFAVTAYSWWGKASATLESVHDVGA